jgi:hypothetical protein
MMYSVDYNCTGILDNHVILVQLLKVQHFNMFKLVVHSMLEA